MVMCRKTVYLALALNLLPGSVSAQGLVPDLPDLIGVKLRAKVSMESEPGVLRFEYRVDNAAGSLPVDALVVPLGSDASRAAVTIDGLDNSAGGASDIVRDLLGLSSTDHVLVAYPSAPDSWLAVTDATRSARWGAARETAGVQVGQTLDGYVMLTRALPGIR